MREMGASPKDHSKTMPRLLVVETEPSPDVVS